MITKKTILEKETVSYTVLDQVLSLSMSQSELMVVVMLILTIISLFFGGDYAWGGIL